MWPFRRREPEPDPDTHDRALWQIGDAWPGPSTHAGVTVNADTALRLAAVWACVRLLADTVSTMPVHVFREGTRQGVTRPRFLVKPAADTPFHEWVGQVMWSVLLRGAAYGTIADRAGPGLRPVQIELVHPDRVAVTLKPDGITVERRLDGRLVDRDDLWTFAGYRFPGKAAPLSPIAYARETIGVGLASQRYGAGFFDAGGPTGVLSSEQSLTRDQAEVTKLLWQSRFEHGNDRGVAVLGYGAKFQPISVNPDEAQFLETQQLTWQQVAGIYGVPPESIAASVQGSSITYSNVEQRPLDLLKFGVGPWLVRLETALTELLPADQTVRFDPAGLLRADLKTRYEAYRVALEAGFLTVDEVRELEDRPPLPAGARPGLEAVA